MVVETNWYHQEYLHLFDDGTSPQPDVTEAEMFAILAVTLQMVNTVPDRLKVSWTKLEQFCCMFYERTMVRSVYHIYHFLYFTDNNRNGVDRTYDSIDKLRKTRGLFEILRTDVSKFYNPSEHLEVDEVIVKFKRSVIFKQCIHPPPPHAKASVSASEWRAMSRVFNEGREAKSEIKMRQVLGALCVDRFCFSDNHRKDDF
jgi:hypothetical protein